MSRLTKASQIPFTQVSNQILTCPTLSFKAKGLYAYMYSKPDGWNFSSERISKQTKECKKSILSAINELKDHGIISYQKQSDGTVDYIIYHEINLDPKGQNGTVPKRHCAKTAPISNKETTSNKERASNTLSDSLTDLANSKRVNRQENSAKPQTIRSRSDKRENFKKFRTRIQETYKGSFTLPKGATDYAPSTTFTISPQGYIIKTNCQNNSVSPEDAQIIWQYLYETRHLDVKQKAL